MDDPRARSPVARPTPALPELQREVLAAVRRGELERAAVLYDELERETTNSADLRMTCNLLTAGGILRDAQGRFEEAEAHFTRTVSLNQELREHRFVVSALRSLGIVRAKRGNDEGALDAHLREAEKARAHQPYAETGALNRAGARLIALRRFSEASDLFERAITAVVSDKTPVNDRADVFLGAGEAKLGSGEPLRAYTRYRQATQFAYASMDAALAAKIGRAWFHAGLIARDHLKDQRAAAETLLWYATVVLVVSDPLASSATAGLEAMGTRTFAIGDPNDFRLVGVGPGLIELAAARRGFFQCRHAVDAPLGAVFDVEVEGFEVRALRRRATLT